jgi:hypothetical protein
MQGFEGGSAGFAESRKVHLHGSLVPLDSNTASVVAGAVHDACKLFCWIAAAIIRLF